MNSAFIYPLVGIGLFSLGLYALMVQVHLMRKILAINVIGSGVFLVLVSLAKRTGVTPSDPVPQAMVITGIVVAISATALALILMLKLTTETQRSELSEDHEE